MAKHKKHSAPDSGGLIAYLKGLLTRKEQHAYEKDMMRDPFEEDAYDGLSALRQEDLEADLDKLKSRLEDRTENKRRRIVLLPRLIAAAVLILAVGTTLFLLQRPVEKTPSKNQIAQSFESEKSNKTAPAYDTLAGEEAKILAERKTPKSKADKSEKSGTSARKKESEAALMFTMKGRESEAEVSFNDEVTVGYGEVKKRIEPGNLGTNTEDTYKLEPQEQTGQTLQGIAAGAKVTQNRSKVDPNINIMTYEDKTEGGLRTIKGVVISSADGSPLPGVTVQLKGTEEGTVTDMDGKFAMNIPANGESTLDFSYIGFMTEELNIADERDITLAMTEDIVGLDEVVVVGYGTQKKSDLTGSVSSISSDDLSISRIENNPPVSEPVVIPPMPVITNREYKRYIEANINYDNLPPFDKPVTVKLEFTVSPQGAIQNIKVRKSGGAAFDKEAIRLLQQGPAWTAGTVNGSPKEDKGSIKIRFEPQK